MILIDDRAGSKELVKYRPLSDPEVATLCRLDSADVAFAGNGPDGELMVGVEVKSTWDLLSSSATGRLQATQLPAMLRAYEVPWLLHYGVYRAGSGDNAQGQGVLQVQRKGTWVEFALGRRSVPYGYLEGLLLDLAATGVRIKSVGRVEDAAAWIGVLHRWWSKPWSGHKGLRTFDRSREIGLLPGMDAGVRLRARVASCLPGVGFERAVAVARGFGSVREMINAGEERWTKVAGIGKVVAKAVEEAVR